MANKLVLRSKNSPFTGQFVDINQGSVLSHSQLDDNFIYLKGEIVYDAELNDGIITFNKINGNAFDVDVTDLVASAVSQDTFVTGITIETGLTASTIVLTNNDGDSVSGDLSTILTYTSPSATSVDVGGIQAGSTFNNTPLTAMWTDLLYPELIPRFNAFDLSGVGGSVEVGATINSGSQTFTWNTVNSSFIKANTVSITDVTNGVILASSLADDGSETVTFPSNIQKTTKNNHLWRIRATKKKGGTFYRNHRINWYWRRYWGNSTDTTLTASQITGLTNSDIAVNRTGTFDFAGGGYKYFAFEFAEGAVDLFRDEATNLQVAMAGPSDGYTNLAGDYYYKTVSVTNQYGITTNYRLYRSKNILNGDISIIVT